MDTLNKVLLTGCDGFIGGYIVEKLLESNFYVIGVDNHSKYKNITRNFQNNPNYEFHQMDVRDEHKLKSLLVDCDYMIAGAALIGGISYFHTFAYDLLSQNEQIMASTCNAAIDAYSNNKLKKVLYLSSSMVFESTNKWPSEEGSELKIPPPESAYGFQKLAVEYFAKSAYQQYKLPYTIIRPFNCVGIGESRAKSDKIILSGDIELAMSHVVPDLIQKIIKGQDPLIILGSGNQIRHYTYGEDLANGIVRALTHKNALNEDFNISTTESTTVIDLAEKIWKKINPNKKFNYVLEKGFQHDVEKRIPSTEKAKKLLNFECKTSLDQMLDIVIPWVSDAIKKDLI